MKQSQSPGRKQNPGKNRLPHHHGRISPGQGRLREAQPRTLGGDRRRLALQGWRRTVRPPPRATPNASSYVHGSSPRFRNDLSLHAHRRCHLQVRDLPLRRLARPQVRQLRLHQRPRVRLPKLHVAYTRGGKSTYPREGLVAQPIEIGKPYTLRLAVRDRLVNVWLNDKFQIAYHPPGPQTRRRAGAFRLRRHGGVRPTSASAPSRGKWN